MKRNRDQNGASLILVLGVSAVVGVLLTASLAYALTATKSTRAYAAVQVARYEADGAIKEAVNYVKDQPLLGRDPDLSANDPACRYTTTAQSGDVITVDCAAEAGSGSGKPNEGGLTPPAAMILTGALHQEPGPYNVPACKGWWDAVANFFNPSTSPEFTIDSAESSGLFARREGLGTLNFSCNQKSSRTPGLFKVSGDVFAAGKLRVLDGQLDVAGAVKTRFGCSSGVLTTPNVGCGTATAAEVADPGGSAAAGLGQSSAYQAVGFNSNGSPSGSMPERTTAYQWGGDGQPLSALASCTAVGNSTTIIFLPGWYKSADVLNRYTNNASCSDRTYWFAPDPGPDGLLLTDDDVTGAFYFDFRTGSAGNSACNGAATHIARWCVGATAAANPRIVVGTPKDWSPLGATAASPGGSDTRKRISVSVSDARTIDDDLSQRWINAAGANNINDTNYARYEPWLWFSSDRAIRIRNFGTTVTGGPIDDPGYPNGRVFVKMAYGVTRPQGLTTALEIKTVTAASGTHDCGTYSLPTQTVGSGNVPPVYTFTDAQAAELATKCGSPDRLNGLEFTLKTTGNIANIGTPHVYVGGVSYSFESLQGASFPNPANVGTGSQMVAARGDCDPTKAGSQLIFGGASHVMVADGSIEVCSGTYPTNPEDHQSIGVYGVPQVQPLRPTAITGDGGLRFKRIDNGANALAIGEPAGAASATIVYGGCAAACSGDYEEGRAKLTMPSYSAPAGYRISKVKARVAYNSNNSGGWMGFGQSSQLQIGSCNIDLPLTTRTIQYSNAANVELFNGGRNCLGASLSGDRRSLVTTYPVFSARANCSWAVCKAGGGEWADTLDGVEFDIELEPIDSSKPYLIPQNGCITARPNYNAGEGAPDCAMMRAVTAKQADSWSLPWSQKEGEWRGRISVKGTVYAPSAAVEVDDTDYAYPLANRGLIVRHLMVSGWAARSGYELSAVSQGGDNTPAPREMTFTACSQTAQRRSAGQVCDESAGDKVLARSRVRFDIDPDAAVAKPNKARIPSYLWWSSNL